MKIGANNIVDCKIGSNQVNKVYIGSNLIWQKSSNFLENLVAYYPFETNSNDVVNNYNGTNFGTVTYPLGKSSNGLDLGSDGTLRWVDISDVNDLSFTDGVNDVPFSISFWIKFVGSFPSIGSNLINKRLNAGGVVDAEYGLNFSANIFSFRKFSEGNSAVSQRHLSATINPVFGTWYHVVYTSNGSGNLGGDKFYINGNLSSGVNSNTGSYLRMANGTSKVRLGYPSYSDALGINYQHRGMLDELAIWKNRELTFLEVIELYNAGAGKFYNDF